MRSTLCRRALIFLLPLLSCPGCIWWPDHGHLQRGEIPAAQLEAFVVGQATRAEVVLALGQPEWVSADECRLFYWVAEVHSWLAAYMVADAAAIYFATDHFHLFEFDERGMLRRQRHVERGAEHSTNDSNLLWMSDAQCAALFNRPDATR